MKGSPAISLFKRLTSAPTAPFCEEANIRQVRLWARRRLGDEVRIRRLRGALALAYRKTRGPSLVLAAHLDHPGFHLSSVTARGARAKLFGGLPKEFLPGAEIEAFPARPKGNDPLARGVLEKERKGFFPVAWTSPPAGSRRPVFAVLALPPAQVRGRWLRSRSIDDVLGCALCLEALRRVAASKARTNLTVLLHRAEEAGFVGALDLILSGVLDPGDSFISIETSRRMPGASPGKGPVIRTGDKAGLFDPNLVAFLDETAARLAKRGLRFQRARLTGGTCEATAHQTFGLQAAGLAIPLVNYHNRGRTRVQPEMVRLDDIEPAARLLAEAAFRFPSAHLRGALRRRLRNIHRKHSPLLSKRF
ncbi:MAG: hypothetical protein HY748_10455 [Elusimicrobia bacterium]|nr:hypothetical protein [Elusimicrobiota bacterium]